MTRDFNKQRRNDARPPFRNSSSHYNRDEQASRSPRPRLNRETVDRAWESGAQQRHADYRPRSNNRQGGQYRQSSQRAYNGNSSQHNNSYNNRTSRSDSPYGVRDERGSRSSYDRNQGSYPESRGPRNTNGNRRDSYRENRYESSSRPSYQDRDRRSQNNNQYANDRGSENRNGSQRRNDFQERERYSGNNGYSRSQSRPYQSQGRDQQRNDRSRPYQRYEQRDEEQRRPRQEGRYTEHSGRQHQNSFESRENRHAQFEGDYEWYDNQQGRDERPERPPRADARPFRGSPTAKEQRHKQPRERHVTPLPDGRVLKGPRPVQRRNAQFWTGVSEETDELLHAVSPVEQPPTSAVNETSSELPTPTSEAIQNTFDGTGTNDTYSNEDEAFEGNTAPATKPEETGEAPRRRTRAASAVVRKKKDKGNQSNGNAPVLKPSQRGFKWPTP